MPIHAVSLCDAFTESFLLFLLSPSLSSSLASPSPTDSTSSSIVPSSLPSFVSEPLIKKILHKMLEDSIIELQAAPLESLKNPHHSIKLSYIYQGFMYNFRYFPNCTPTPTGSIGSSTGSTPASLSSLKGLVYFCLNSLNDSSADSFQFLKDLHALFLRLSNDGNTQILVNPEAGATRRAFESLVLQRIKAFDSGKMGMPVVLPPVEFGQKKSSGEEDGAGERGNSNGHGSGAGQSASGDQAGVEMSNHSQSHSNSDRVGLLGGDKKDSASVAGLEDEKTSRIKSQISSVQNLLSVNLRSAAERGEKLQELMEASDNLSLSSDRFNESGRRLKRHMCWNVWKLRLLLLTILAFVVYAIIASACGVQLNRC